MQIGDRIKIVAEKHPWSGHTGVIVAETGAEHRKLGLDYLVALDTLPATMSPAVGEHEVELLAEPVAST